MAIKTPRSPSQRIDQLIHLVDQALHLTRVVAAISSLAELVHAVAIGARAVDGGVELCLAGFAGHALGAVSNAAH